MFCKLCIDMNKNEAWVQRRILNLRLNMTVGTIG